MIDYIEDLALKKKYLIKLKEIILNQQFDKKIIKPFNMKKHIK